MDTKQYPTNYPADAVAILDSMSVTKGKGVELVGSMSLRSQQYAGDYDANDFIKLEYQTSEEALNHCASEFREAIRRTSKLANAYIGDIKCGEVAEWRVFGEDTRVHNGKVIGYNAETSRSKVRALRRAQIITPTEEKETLALLPTKPTPIQLVKAKDSIKFHIIRWSVAEVLEGEKRLNDGRIYTLQDGFSSQAITKVDVVAWIQNNRYTEFSMIYFLFNKGKALNPVEFDYEDSLKESILYYASEGMYFKVLKRQFSLAKFKDDQKQIEKLTAVLNSDLGRLYHIISDIRTLIFLLEEQSKLRMSDIKFEIDQFKGRMANIYSLDPFLKKEFVFLGYINSALKTTSSKQLLGILKSMDRTMSNILGKASQKFVGGKAEPKGTDELESLSHEIKALDLYYSLFP
jgi:predicted DNA-binding transcriptional regulator